MLVAKLWNVSIWFTIRFENYVNYAGSKTIDITPPCLALFENYVNYAGSKTSTGDVARLG